MDVAFRDRLANGEAAALQDYNLDASERAALLSATADKLLALGVDVGSSKWGIGRSEEQDSVIEWFNAQFP